MKATTMTRWMFLLGLAAVVALTTLPSVAQSEAELRRENDRLTARVTELERELAAALDRIKVLEAQNAALKTSGGSTRLPSEQPEEEKVSVDETQADASPRALLAALKKNYEGALGDVAIGDTEDSRERNGYLRAVERWQAKAAREHRLGAEWLVSIEDIKARGEKGITLLVQAIDPVHGTKLGDPFLALVPNNRVRVIDDEGLDRLYVFRGTLTPQIIVNPDRESVGAVDHPRFIGPFAEFELVMDVNAAVPGEFSAPADSGGGGSTGAGAGGG